MEPSRFYNLEAEPTGSETVCESDTHEAPQPAEAETADDTAHFFGLPKIQEVLDQAALKGSIEDEALEALTIDLDPTPEQVDLLLGALEDLGVEIVPSEPDSESPEKKEPEWPQPGDKIAVDSLNLFLRQMGRHELLTPAEEIELAKKIERGDQQAKETMIVANLRLVIAIAKGYRTQGMPFLDLIQEGVIGLDRAVEKFDWRLGYRFSTYATWWIRQAVTRAITEKSHTIRIPVHTAEKLNKIARVERQLVQELGREPTEEEIAEGVDMTPEEVISLRQHTQPPVSLEKPVGEDGEWVLGDLIADESALPLEHQVEVKRSGEVVQRLLGTLTERQRQVVELRYGLKDERVYTLDEVGEQLGVTRERVRQIQKDALIKLRTLPETETLGGM